MKTDFQLLREFLENSLDKNPFSVILTKEEKELYVQVKLEQLESSGLLQHQQVALVASIQIDSKENLVSANIDFKRLEDLERKSFRDMQTKLESSIFTRTYRDQAIDLCKSITDVGKNHLTSPFYLAKKAEVKKVNTSQL